jgi:hypothetical protein
MAGTIVVDRRTFNRGIDAMMKEYGTSAAGVMRRQMSILSGQLAKKYPPHGRDGMKTNAKKFGKEAIRNDMKKLFVAMPAEDYEDLKEWQDEYRGTRDVFDYEGQRIEQWHKAHFDSRIQRVPKKAITGNWQGYGRRFSNKLHVKEKDLKKYESGLFKNIGKLAGAWTAGSKRWKGAGNMSWRNNFSQYGKAVDRMREDGSGYLLVENRVQGAARWKRIDSFVVKSRERGFQKELKAAVRKADKAGNRVR